MLNILYYLYNNVQLIYIITVLYGVIDIFLKSNHAHKIY